PCLKIYPNPISGKAKLKFSLAEPQPVSIRVFDLTGKIVLSGQYDLCAGEHTYQFNLSSQGCYCVQVQTYKNKVQDNFRGFFLKFFNRKLNKFSCR
ncbi:MAG: T9SS type A sorting domain-containing protein, partial [Clostridiales bacterium]|nr:T9SS type A sorting domain-containing protein [Clostridiales bacterium]